MWNLIKSLLIIRNYREGVNYRVLHKAKQSGYWPVSLQVLILSAKHALLDPQTLIEYDDQFMSREQAVSLQQKAGAELDAILTQQHFDEVFINLGKLYLLALATSQELPHLGARAHYATGGIGERMAQMKHWLIHIAGHQGLSKICLQRSRRDGSLSSGLECMTGELANVGKKGKLMLDIDVVRAQAVSRLLLGAYAQAGIFGNKEMPEDLVPPGVVLGSEAHLRFITLTVAIDSMRDADQLWNASRTAFADPATSYLFVASVRRSNWPDPGHRRYAALPACRGNTRKMPRSGRACVSPWCGTLAGKWAFCYGVFGKLKRKLLTCRTISNVSFG